MTDTDLPLDIENMSAAERYARTPRPLNFVRVRLHRGGQAEYVMRMFEDEKADLFEDLTELRKEGKDESDDEVQEVRTNLRHVLNALGDIQRGMIELVGPDIP